MASGLYFRSACPTCGRKLEIRVELLGKMIVCQQCGAEHLAMEASERAPLGQVSDERIERALARARAFMESVDSMNATASE